MVGLPEPRGSRAVLVGASGFDTLDALPAVAGNLSALGDLLAGELWGLPDGHLTTVAEPRSPSEVSRAVREAARAATDTLLVYYAGHGLIDPGSGELHLAVSGSDPRSVYDTAVPYEWIRRAVERSPAARRIVVLDCCYSARAFGAQSAEMADLAEADGTYVLAAAAETAVALAPVGEPYTAFTGELVTLLDNGVPGLPEFLSLDTVFERLRSALAAKERPAPQSLCRNRLGSLPFARNAAFAAGSDGPRPERPGRLPAGLRAAQRRAAGESPYQLYGPRRPPLSEVYVHRGLAGTEGEKWSGAAPGAGPQPVAQALAEHEHLLIVAGPGLGKSTLTLQLAATPPEAGGGDGSGERLVPLRVSARELAARRGLPWARAVAEAASAELGQHLDGALPAELVARPVDGARWLLLVDGLDEVPDPSARGELAEVLAGRMSEPGGPHRLVVTTRPLGQAEMDRLAAAPAGRFTVQPFDEEALKRFAGGWFAYPPSERGGSLASRFLAQVSQARLAEAVTVPLMATVAAVVFEQDPDRPLPTGRRELYDEFLGHLNSRWGERNWRLLRERVADVEGGPAALDALRAGRGELVRRLARVRLEGEEPLLRAAMAWAGANSAVPTGSLSQWREVVATVLTGTGPLVREGGEVRFVHQSFADHLAAEVYADELPERFDRADPRWRSWVEGCLEEYGSEEELARAVVLLHSRRHPGNRLLSWLLGQTENSRLLACRLAAAGAPTEPWERKEMLACAVRWLTQSDVYRSGTTLFGLMTVRWLSDWRTPEAVGVLLRIAEGRPRDSESWTYANVELAGLGDPWRPAALRRLRGVMLDRTVPEYERYKAAQGLAEGDEASRDDCVAVLAELVTGSSTPEHVRCSAAGWLVELAPDRREVALRSLREIMAGPGATSAHVQASETLVALAPECRAEAAEVLRRVASSTTGMGHGWAPFGAALSLARLGPGYDAEGVGLLRERTGARYAAGDRVNAVSALRILDAGYLQECAEVLLDIVRTPGGERSGRVEAAMELMGFGVRHRETGTRLLRDLIAECPSADSSVVRAAEALLAAAPQHRDEVVGALRRWIAGLGRGPVESTFDIAQAVKALGSIGPQFASEAAAFLREALRTGGDAVDRPTLAQTLAELGGEYRAEGIASLRRMARGGPGTERPDAELHLEWLNAGPEEPASGPRE